MNRGNDQNEPGASAVGEPMLLGTSVPKTEEDWALLCELGFTLFQTDSDHLNTNEIAAGQWEWSPYDEALETTRRHGGKWQFFPHFHFPPPWNRTDDFARMSCLEHHRTVEAWSLWAPGSDADFEKGYAALAQHYGLATDRIGAFYIGIHGDYGECMVMAACRMGEESQKRDWIERFGNDHNHYGYWCDDSYARASFARFLCDKYGQISELNRAWGSEWRAFESVDYPSSPQPSRRAWLDFIQWYYDSMTYFTERVLRIARQHFPRTLMMIPMGGGDENPCIAQDNTRLPKICKPYDVRARSTHGGAFPFPRNYARVKRISTASRFYGVPFWAEPPSRITAEGEVARFFESISCGSEGFWDWATNPLASPQVFRQFGSYLTVEQPVVDVAVFFPQTSHRLNSAELSPHFPPFFEQGAADIRQVMDWDVLDEQLILDGALDRYRVLVLFEGNIVERDALEQISKWVEAGGLLVGYDFGLITTVENDPRFYNALFGLAETTYKVKVAQNDRPFTWEVNDSEFLQHTRSVKAREISQAFVNLADSARVLAVTQGGNAVIWAVPHGRGYGIFWGGSWGDRATYYELIRDVVYHASALDPLLGDALAVDNAWDGTYATLFAGGRILYFNPTHKAIQKAFEGHAVSLGPVSLGMIKLAAL